MTFQLYLHTAPSFSSCLSMFLGRYTTVRPKSSTVDGWYLLCDSGPQSESANLISLTPQSTPLHQTTTPGKRSTPTDCSSGLDSDSAALLVMPSEFTYSCPSFHATLSHSSCIAQSHCVGDRVVAILIGLHIICYCILFQFTRWCTPSQGDTDLPTCTLDSNKRQWLERLEGWRLKKAKNTVRWPWL